MIAAPATAFRPASAAEVAAEAAPADEWPKPINLLAPLAAPPLTRADVPQVIGDAAELFARAGGFDPTGAIASGVAATAATIDDGIRILLPGPSGHFESSRLWLALVAASGSGKSPSQRPALLPIHEMHRELVTETARRREADANAATPMRALFTGDATIDKLADVLRDNPRGILFAVDEFDSWLGGIEAFSRDGGSRNRGEWMRLYDGGPHQVDRVQRGSFFIPNWGASILTATTPAALARMSKKLPADGLFQRFMPFCMERMCLRDTSVLWPDVERAQTAYDSALRQLFAFTADAVDPPIVRLSAGATQVYETERARMLALTGAAEAHSESFAAHVAKHPAMLARVMLTFHAVADDRCAPDGSLLHPCNGPVSEATAHLASRFMRKAYRHSYAIYSAILGAGAPLELAQAIARAILADELPVFNRRDLTHKCRAWRGASDWQKTAALRALEDFGWIDGDTILPEHGGRWTVNPGVHLMFAGVAVEARARRELVREALQERFK